MLTPPDNAVALADRLEHLLADDQLRAQIGVAAADRAQRFGWPSVACDILRVYRETLEQSTLSRSIAMLPRAEAC